MSAIDKATPGPWRLSDTSIIAGEDDSGKCLAVIETDGGYEAPWKEREANAALIVKAVNLFEAHEALVKATSQDHSHILTRDNQECPICVALNALSTLREKEGV